jgi:hypothetical protein
VACGVALLRYGAVLPVYAAALLTYGAVLLTYGAVLQRYVAARVRYVFGRPPVKVGVRLNTGTCCATPPDGQMRSDSPHAFYPSSVLS